MAETPLEVPGYSFKNPELLKTALTHRSVGPQNNERLEFLGDAVIGLAVAEQLLEHFPEEDDEGHLTQARAQVVSRGGLAKAARRLKMGPSLYLAPGEAQSGGAQKDRILCGAFEALAGAIFMDGGYLAAREFCKQTLEVSIGETLQTNNKDPKNLLQERAQSAGLPLPNYSVQEISGEDHNPVFEIRVEVGCISTLGIGTSKKSAERDAAEAALKVLAKHPDIFPPANSNS